MLAKGEKVLEETLDYNAVDETGKIDSGIARIKLDAAKVVVTTLGKDEGYTTRQELTAKDGEKLELGVVILPERNEKES